MRRRRGPIVAVLGAAAVVALAGLVPSTSGAFFAKITNTNDTAASAATFKCADVFSTQTNRSNAYFEYTLSETGSTAADSSSAANPGTFQGTHNTETLSPTACPNDASKVAYRPNVTGTTPQYVTTASPVGTAPATFSLVVWFKTSVKAGKLIGLGANQTGANTTYDRHIYLLTTGQLAFGTYSGGYQIVTSPSGTNYADGLWHQVVATFTAGSPNTGMTLYVDGASSASNAAYTTAENDTGYWRIGYDSLALGWTNSLNENGYFTGSIKFAAAYKYVLSPAEVHSEYTIGAPG